jgi:predicted KAP-like P-loop ATPase
VQASFDVPTVEGARVEAAVLNGLDRLLSGALTAQNGFDQTRWENVWQGGLRKLFRNLRDVQRFLASLNVHLNLHRGRRFFEINLVDFIAIEALRVFEPDVFSAVSHAKGLLTGQSDRSESMRAPIVAITASLEGDRRDTVNVVLGQLFPSFGWALGGSHYGRDWNAEWLRGRRICSQRHFDRYFMLRLPDGEISDSEFRDFLELNEKTKIVGVFEDFAQRGLLPVLLARLDEINKELPLENIGALLPALIDIGDAYDNSAGFSLSTPFIATWRTASWYLKGVADIDQRGQVFLAAMRNSIGLAVLNTLIGLEDDRREKAQSDDGETLTDADLSSAKDILLHKIRAASATPAVFLGNPHFVRLLNAWKGFVGDDEPRRWIAEIVKDSALLLKLLKAFTFMQQSHTFGEYVTRSTKTFGLNPFKAFADLDQVNAVVGKLDASGLNEAELEALAAYVTATSGVADEDFVT